MICNESRKLTTEVLDSFNLYGRLGKIRHMTGSVMGKPLSRTQGLKRPLAYSFSELANETSAFQLQPVISSTHSHF
jgi:hypothetical protein